MPTPPTLRIGSSGPDVRTLQAGLHVPVDGDFGPVTGRALALWQERHGLYADGVFGPVTRAAWLLEHGQLNQAAGPSALLWVQVPADPRAGGYNRFTLRADAAQAYERVLSAVHAAGGIITSAGGRRNLSAAVSSARSSTSLHYLGRALDLALYSGMVDPAKDPYIVTLDDADRRLWRVWARAEHGEEKTLNAWTYRREIVEVTAKVIDLTAAFAAEGFDRIPARPGFFVGRRDDVAAEWWHFSWTTGLEVGKTTFGSELERVWSAEQLRGTGPWTKRRLVWRGAGFS